MIENNINNLNQVFDVLDNLDLGSHLVMFYEEPEYAHMVEYQFIKTGLKKGESCLYMTHVDDDIDVIEQSMTDFGISVEKYKKNHLLNIHRMTDGPADSRCLMQVIQKLIKEIKSNSKAQFRIVSRFTTNIESEEERKANMNVERKVQSSFEKCQGSLMCTYQVKDIKPEMKGVWMQNHLKNHHAVVFVLNGGDGLAFNLPANIRL